MKYSLKKLFITMTLLLLLLGYLSYNGYIHLTNPTTEEFLIRGNYWASAGGIGNEKQF